MEITKNIIERLPKTVLAMDNEGRTALHYAKDERIKQFLINGGADEMVFDQNGRLPSYYRTNPKDIPLKLLEVVPEAPRTSLTFPPVWDWSVLNLTDSVSISAFEPRGVGKSDGADIWQNGHSDEESNQIAAVLAKNKEIEVESERKRAEDRRRAEEERVKKEAELKRKQLEDEKKRRVEEEKRKEAEELRKREVEEKRRREADEKRREIEEKKRKEDAGKVVVGRVQEDDDRALAEERQRMLDEGLILPPDDEDFDGDGDVQK